MSDVAWEVVYEANGPLQAEMLRGFLEAQDIPVVLSQEGLGKVYGLTVGPLGIVQILVPVAMIARAHQLLIEFESGSLMDKDAQDTDTHDLDDLTREMNTP